MVILHKTIPEIFIIPTTSRNTQKEKSTEREFLKLFDEKYCFQPIKIFDNKPTDRILFVNSFLVVYYPFLPRAIECENNPYVHLRKLCLKQNTK